MSSEARILYFDLWRCLCVCMVVITHCWEGTDLRARDSWR